MSYLTKRQNAVNDTTNTLTDISGDKLRSLSPPSEQKWILCSDKLPEEGKSVFVYLFGSTPYIAWYSHGHWFTDEFEVEKEYEPVAWMLLPDSYYKVEANE